MEPAPNACFIYTNLSNAPFGLVSRLLRKTQTLAFGMLAFVKKFEFECCFKLFLLNNSVFSLAIYESIGFGTKFSGCFCYNWDLIAHVLCSIDDQAFYYSKP